MNIDTSSSVLPSLTADYLARHDVQVDNLFNNAWQRIGFNKLLKTIAIYKAFRHPCQCSDLSFITLGVAQGRLYCDVLKGVVTKLLDH